MSLACDSIAVSGAISRRDYSMALLKSQVMVGVLPFGCNWPGPQHPLVERIALLQRKPPGAARRLAGVGLVLLTATSAGLGAWAAQPPVAAKAVTAEQASMAQTTLPAIVAVPGLTAGDTDSNQLVAQMRAKATPVLPPNAQRSAHDATTTSADSVLNERNRNNVPSQGTISALQSQREAIAKHPTETLAPPSPDLSGVLSSNNLATPTVVASNDARSVTPNDLPTAPVQPMNEVDPSVAAQGLSRDAAVTPAKKDSNKPYVRAICTSVPNNTVTGRVISPKAIQINRFECHRSPDSVNTLFYGFGPCKNNGALWDGRCPNRPPYTMNVQLANPADASKMPRGKLVTLKGDFLVIAKDKVDYLFVQNARVLYADPFGR